MADAEPENQTLAEKTAAGLLWTAIGFAFARVFTLLSQFIIAYLITPEDFGVVGLGIAIFHFFMVLANPGIDRILTNQNERVYDWVPVARKFLLFGSIASVVLMSVLSPVMAHVFNEPRLTAYVPFYSLAVVSMNFSALYRAIHQTQLNFKIISLYDFILGFVLAAVSLIGVWAGMNIYAFPLGQTVASFAATGYLMVITSTRGPHEIQPVNVRDLIDSVRVRIITEFSEFIRIYGPYFILGVMASSHEVGLFHFAFRIALQTAILVRTAVGNVFFSVFSFVRKDVERQRTMFLKSSRLLGMSMVPLLFVQAVLVHPLIDLVFEDKWLAAIPVCQVLSIAVGIRMLQEGVASYLMGAGEFRADMKLRVLLTSIFLPVMAAGGYFGTALSISYAFLIFVLFMVVVANLTALRIAQLEAPRLLYILSPVLPAAVLLFVPIVFAQEYFHWGPILTVIATGIASLLYLGVLRYLCAEEWTFAIDMLKRPVDKYRKRIPLLRSKN